MHQLMIIAFEIWEGSIFAWTGRISRFQFSSPSECLVLEGFAFASVAPEGALLKGSSHAVTGKGVHF
jgi:hypothetical protein